MVHLLIEFIVSEITSKGENDVIIRKKHVKTAIIHGCFASFFKADFLSTSVNNASPAGLMAIVRDAYELDPYSNSLFLFCGKRCDRLKALHFDKDGFVLYYKRLDSGRFQRPRNPDEVKNLTRQEFRWLMEGLSISQPKAIKPTPPKKF